MNQANPKRFAKTIDKDATAKRFKKQGKPEAFFEIKDFVISTAIKEQKIPTKV